MTVSRVWQGDVRRLPPRVRRSGNVTPMGLSAATLFLALRQTATKWNMLIHHWREALMHFTILWPETDASHGEGGVMKTPNPSSRLLKNYSPCTGRCVRKRHARSGRAAESDIQLFVAGGPGAEGSCAAGDPGHGGRGADRDV